MTQKKISLTQMLLGTGALVKLDWAEAAFPILCGIGFAAGAVNALMAVYRRKRDRSGYFQIPLVLGSDPDRSGRSSVDRSLRGGGERDPRRGLVPAVCRRLRHHRGRVEIRRPERQKIRTKMIFMRQNQIDKNNSIYI